LKTFFGLYFDTKEVDELLMNTIWKKLKYHNIYH
jgi:hypothetical protein